ncbi:MAG: two-component system, response regulator YesN [Petroclostridium sp.]|uniref:response regulator transcription factor n=1 Tax=Petroclostridium xylanilyticum TaxID=1792311 RepID=UPI0018E34057|nr:response regulator [Petroclostridium xylanilyticum]MBZ4645969.1 response regulator [Clostridia bacterium]MDK2809606.1 two-component system, response regulator YesN [Petroclostridium sp.]
MHKIMIVDDESLVRIGIKSCINWEENGFEVVGEASNGGEAVELFEKLKPDIILTDIKMPLLNGIEMIKRIKCINPNTKIIVLSCLNEYDYVREAMKYGAVDYLFKPTMTPEDILNVLKEIKEKIVLERNKNKEIKKLEEQANQSLSLLRERYLNNLLNSGIKDLQNIKNDFDRLDINFDPEHFILLLIEFDDYEKIKEKYTYNDIQMLYLSCINAVNDIMKQYNNGVCFMHETRKIVVLFNVNHYSQKCENQKVIEVNKKIQIAINNYLGISVTIGVSNVSNSINNISIAFEQALQALNQKFVLGKGKIIKFKDIACNSKNLKEVFALELNDLYEAARAKNIEDIFKNITILFSAIKKKEIPQKEDVCALVIEIIIEFLRIFRDEITLEDFFGDRHNMLHEVYKNDTLAEIEEWVKKIITMLIDNIQKKKNSHYSPAIAEALRYITRHYADEISLESISNHVNMSKNYFSMLFKQEVGINFIYYLAKVRVENARRLLEENIKIYEAARLVGYNDYRHFCRVFKKVTGVTPSEVKKA